jgi:hypothetical protein
MSMRSTNMLVNNGQLDQTGLATRADGYYGFADGLQTVGFYLKNFIGRIYVDATLSDNPEEADWFPVSLGESTDFVDYDSATTKIETFNIIGNFVYLRAKIRRSQLGLPVGDLGTCERVTLSL